MDISDGLAKELVRMRRNPANFNAGEPTKCKLCGKGKSAYPLLNAKSDSKGNIGLWCSVHGWLYFDSVGFPPTERLTASELDDQRLRQQRQERLARKAGFDAFCQEQNEL